MITVDIMNHAFKALSDIGPQSSSLDPDNVSLDDFAIDDTGMRRMLKHMERYRKPNKDKDKHDKGWWFRHGIIIGTLFGVTAARIEASLEQQISAQRWAQLDNLLGGRNG